MALGMNFNSGGDGDIVPYVKYDSRAGRISRDDRTQSPDGNYGNDIVDITSSFKAVIDMENIEIGFFLFTTGAALQMQVVPIGQVMPQKPAGEGWKQGARVMMKLHKSCGGDVREMSGNAASFLRGFDELHTAYEAGKAANPGKLPIVVLKSAQPVTTGQGARKSTNYQPVFEITGWAPRPVDLVFVSKAAGHKTELPPAVGINAAPPSTGSTQVSAPTPLPVNTLVPQQAAMADANDFG
ncbi:MAG: hypothetical protein H0V18_09165 [Pyrinomonadaceae bacterium]|nr:hypothetical protein [Pyrinomonadaceae bacterium]